MVETKYAAAPHGTNEKGNSHPSSTRVNWLSGYYRAMKNELRSAASLLLLAFGPMMLSACHSSATAPAAPATAPTKKWKFSTGELHPVSRGSCFAD